MSNTLISIMTMLTALAPGSQPSAPCNESIRQQDLKADLFFLAGDAFQGRLTGTAGNTLAAEFIASRFERLGLKRVGNDGSYFQRFRLSTATLGPSNSLEVTCDGVTLRFRAGHDFVPLTFSPSAKATSQLAYAGFGISAPERGHDDYRNLTWGGGIVLILAHEPGENDPESPFDGVVMSEAATVLHKVLTAQEKGAVGVLITSDVHNHPEPENFEQVARAAWPEKAPRIPQYTLEDWAERVRIPAAMVSTSLARTLLRGATRPLEEMARSSERPGEVWSAGSRTTVALSTDVSRHVVPDRNVVAAMEGCDPKLKDEWVVISCHLDHNGADGDSIYNGADDNGSGTVGLLEIAEAYALAAQQGHRPKRSILFAAFDSEERGLLGAHAFVERPLMPLDRIVAVLNMDMIGRNEEVPVGGGSRFRGLAIQSAESNRNALNLLGHSYSPTLARTIEQANAPFGLTLKKDLDNNVSNLLRRSYHWPFLQHGVPAVFIHTGLHPDYHTPGDRPEKIEYAKMERIVRMVHQASWDLAQTADRPRLERRTSVTTSR